MITLCMYAQKEPRLPDCPFALADDGQDDDTISHGICPAHDRWYRQTHGLEGASARAQVTPSATDGDRRPLAR